MKLVTYAINNQKRIGILDDQFIVDPLEVFDANVISTENRAALSDMTRLISEYSSLEPILNEAFLESKKSSRGRISLASVKLLAPMLPSTILCSGSNYLSHNAEKANADTSGKEPEFFIKTSDCVVGPGDAIIHDPVLTKKLDGEVELAIVIGKAGRHIPVEKALDHVFGYTVINDVTARDRQVRRRPDGSHWYELGRGKVFDSSAPLGPCIVTTDEIGDPQNLMVKSWVNGELRQISSTSQMIWTCAQLVHEFSVNLTLKPGMVIITGTPSGTSWSTDKELGGKWSGVDGMIPAQGYLKPGDIIECEVEGIGKLSNPIKSSS
jgi:2-keto-4-pentenoate hydratase/2-oxohepta-3-ene-1,7-dioic acid hydratase in catechol pathway